MKELKGLPEQQRDPKKREVALEFKNMHPSNFMCQNSTSEGKEYLISRPLEELMRL